jgi:hypothetical protein
MIYLERATASAAGGISVAGTARTGGALAEKNLGSVRVTKEGTPSNCFNPFFFRNLCRLMMGNIQAGDCGFPPLQKYFGKHKKEIEVCLKILLFH